MRGGWIWAAAALLRPAALFPWDRDLLWVPADLSLLVFCSNFCLKRCCRETGEVTHSVSRWAPWDLPAVRIKLRLLFCDVSLVKCSFSPLSAHQQ